MGKPVVLFLLFSLLFLSSSFLPVDTNASQVNPLISTISEQVQDIQAAEMVWICQGPHSKKYHSTPDCTGLRRCSTDVIEVTLQKAKSLGRDACKICY